MRTKNLFVLPVEEFRSVQAKVVDLTGKPVEGVPIALILESKEEDFSGGGWSWQADLQVTKGPNGLAQFPLHMEAIPIDSKEGARWRMGPNIPGLVLKTRAFAFRGIPKKRPLKFTIPQTGAIDFRLLDELGQPLKRSGKVSIFGLGINENV